MTQMFSAMEIEVHAAYVAEDPNAADTYLDRSVDTRYGWQVDSVRILLSSGEIGHSSTPELRHRLVADYKCQYTERLEDDVEVVECTQLSTITGGNVATGVAETRPGGG